MTDVNAITAGFGEAIQPHLDTLNQHAATVPSWVSSATAEELQPAEFEAWKACKAAVAVIDQALTATAPLYRRGDGDTFTIEAERHSVVCDVPEQLTFEQAWKWVHAISGRRTLGENNPMGQLRLDNSGAWFAQVAALGGSFRWAAPAERRARLDRLRAATVRPTLERSDLAAPSPLVLR